MTAHHPLDLQATIDELGTPGLLARLHAVRRLVQDDGITFGGGQPDAVPRPWEVDPLPLVIDAAEWARLEAQLKQRARLLDALLVDLYGRRRVLSERVVPAEVVLGHPGFVAAADGVRLPTKRQLPLVATDLARQPDGSWTVLADRPQAPAGAGYAMANRRIVARAMDKLHRHTRLRHLRGFFDLMQVALLDAAPPVDGPPHVVLLTPGPGSDTAYDQALLSTLLGFPLAQSDDLLTRAGRLWMRTTGRLQAVDVVLRQVDAAWSDSLDLRPESRLGVPGLAAAARRGTLSVVNPLGAGVLENPGLVPYLDAVSRRLLGEPLVLESPPTWWCGEPASRAHVLSRLESLVVKPVSREAGPPIAGWELDAAARDGLRRRIDASGWSWTAQEPLATSTAPVVTSTGIEQRSLVLRTFAMALGAEHHVMPGGLARVAAPGQWAVNNRTGSLSKDVWVLESAAVPVPAPLDVAALARTRITLADAPSPGLPPRAAAHLYRLGRNLERAEGSARLLMMADNLLEDHLQRPGTPGHAAMHAVLQAVPGTDLDGRLDHPLGHLRAMLVDPRLPGSVAHSSRLAGAASSEVRELLSQDTFSIVSRLARTLREARAEGDQMLVQPVASKVLESLLALAGLSAESLVRDPTWAFVDAGRRVERALATVGLLRVTLAVVRPPVVESLLTDSVLRVGDSLITYRRRTVAGVGPATPVVAATHILLDDPGNPRSVLFGVERLVKVLAHAPSVRVTNAVRELLTTLRNLDLEDLCAEPRTGLVDVLADLDARLRALADTIERVHFLKQTPQRSFAVAELTRGPEAER